MIILLWLYSIVYPQTPILIIKAPILASIAVSGLGPRVKGLRFSDAAATCGSWNLIVMDAANFRSTSMKISTTYYYCCCCCYCCYYYYYCYYCSYGYSSSSCYYCCCCCDNGSCFATEVVALQI